MDDKTKLKFELVPDSCWYSNLRSILSKEQWSYVRKRVIAASNGKCSICGAQSSRLEAHERWSYNKTDAVQKLDGVIAVCPDCHSVIHIGRTQLMGDEKRASEHYMRVNGCSYSDYRKALGEANDNHRELNKVGEWSLDLTWLKSLT